MDLFQEIVLHSMLTEDDNSLVISLYEEELILLVEMSCVHLQWEGKPINYTEDRYIDR